MLSLSLALLRERDFHIFASLNALFNSFIHTDTCFSEGGALLSFGQRQLFCLARAVLKGSTILVLDEATSNLDYETELLFLKAANDAFKGKTLITIAVSSLISCNFTLFSPLLLLL